MFTLVRLELQGIVIYMYLIGIFFRTKFIKNTLHKLKPLSSCYFSSSIPNFKENENSNKKLLIFSILGAGATWGLYKYVNLQYAGKNLSRSSQISQVNIRYIKSFYI